MLDLLKPAFFALKYNFSSQNFEGKTEYLLVAVNKWLFTFVLFGCWFTEFVSEGNNSGTVELARVLAFI